MNTTVINNDVNRVNNSTRRPYAEPLTAEEREKYQGNGDSPAVYVGTYGKYNAGSIAGMWVALDTVTDSEELHEVFRRIHCDEREPEYMIQDFQNFPKKFYSEAGCDWEGLYEWLGLDEDDRQKVAEYWDEVDDSRDIQGVLDACVYEGEANEYYDELADECMNIPDNLRMYFNYEAWERDCAFDYHETEHYVFSAY